MDNYIKIDDEDIPVHDVQIEHIHNKTDKKFKLVPHKIEYTWNSSIDWRTLAEKIIKPQSIECEKCKHLVNVLQNVNGEVMHCGYNCKKTSMRADKIKETKRCHLYELGHI